MMTGQYEKCLISKITKIMWEGVTTKDTYLTLLLYICLTLPGVAFAGTYWVSPNGTASWSSCSGSTPLNGSAACSLSTANNNAFAGDTIYLRGGTYTQTSSSGCGNNYTCGIFPKNRGTANARITYSAYTNETPIITADPGLTTSKGITIRNGTGPGVGTYIRVTGITFKNLYRWAELSNYANYNEIDHCTFYSETGDDFGGAAGLAINSMCAGGVSWVCYSKHNWIHHNTFSKVQQYGNQPCREGADVIRIGCGWPCIDNTSDTEQDDYNTVEYNTIRYGGHALMDTYGGYNVIRGNIMHNEGWIPDYSGGKCTYPPMPNGKYSHRGLQTSEDFARQRQNILVEGNRFGFSSANPNNPGEANYAIASPSTIVRYNYSFGAHQSGIGTKWYRAFPDGLSTTLSQNINSSVTTIPVASTAGLTHTSFYLLVDSERMLCTGKTETSFTGCTRGYISTAAAHSSGAAVHVNARANRGQAGTGPYNVRIYNNTSYWNGQTYPYMQSTQPGCTTCPGKLAGINVYSAALDVIVKNNIAYNNYSYNLYGYDITVDSGKNPANYPAAIIEKNNWKTTNGDPKFTNPDVSDPTSTTLPNLTLQSSSGAIDGGTYLTQAKGSGSNSKTLIVDDAMYFQDGSWGSDLARGVTFFPDWIAIGTVTNVVQISSINYLTNTITLASPMTWSNGAYIWLYKKSDGAAVLVGAAPDMGASEFGTVMSPPSPPTNFQVVQ